MTPEQALLPGVTAPVTPAPRKTAKARCVSCGCRESAAAWLMRYGVGLWCLGCRRAALVLKEAR